MPGPRTQFLDKISETPVFSRLHIKIVKSTIEEDNELQMDLDEVTEHIHYLKEKTKHIKGLKINYHEKFISQIEAVLTRGNKNLCKLIETLYKKGCYLDAWGEHFDKNTWQETALECNLSLKELARIKQSLATK